MAWLRRRRSVAGIGYRGSVRWDRFVALGDSFTEGLSDPDPAGNGFRGWADLVAGALATRRNGLTYANLAIRGRLLGRIVDEQVPPALAMNANLVTFAAGINDALRRGFDPETATERYRAAVRRLCASGADVVLFRFVDAVAPVPGGQLISSRVKLFNQMVMGAVEQDGTVLVDLSADAEFTNPALWSADRLHLSTSGHFRVAAHVLTALGVDPDPAWWEAPARPPIRGWLGSRSADVVWFGRHLVPWVHRRLTGRSSGDGITAKRPTLSPVIEIGPSTAPD